jgi:hypothetical protein
LNWDRILTPQFLPDLAREVRWKLGARDRAPAERSWPVAPADLASIRVRWPRTYDHWRVPQRVQFLEWGLPRRVRFETADIPQPYSYVVVFEVDVGGATYRHGVDVGDPHDVAEAAVSSCGLYFKQQFAEDGYPFANVIPGGYVPKGPELYAFLPHVRKLRDRNRNAFDVYGRFSPRMATEIRTRARDLLAEQTAFRHEGTLAKVRYSRFLQDAARSRVCLDLPGYGAFCYRLVDNLAIGSCIVGPAPRSRLPVPLEDGVHMAFCRRDLSDLVERCTWYLEHEEERLRLVRGSREYFDRYLHREQLVDYYLTRCLEHHRQAQCGARGLAAGIAPS